MIHGEVRDLSCKPNIYLSGSTLEGGSGVGVITDRLKAVLHLWILFVICVSCLSVIHSGLFLAALWLPARKGMTSWPTCL